MIGIVEQNNDEANETMNLNLNSLPTDDNLLYAERLLDLENPEGTLSDLEPSGSTFLEPGDDFIDDDDYDFLSVGALKAKKGM